MQKVFFVKIRQNYVKFRQCGNQNMIMKSRKTSPETGSEEEKGLIQSE